MLMVRIAAIASRLSTVWSLTRMYEATALLNLSAMCSATTVELEGFDVATGSLRREEAKRLLLPAEPACRVFAGARTRTILSEYGVNQLDGDAANQRLHGGRVLDGGLCV